MVQHADATSDTNTGLLKPSTSSCLPLLVFHHLSDHTHDDEMLMFSLSQQSLHTNLEEHDLLAAMCWTTPQGWMLLVTKSAPSPSPAWLWNPHTGHKLTLPDIAEDNAGMPMACKCLLSHNDPTHPRCVVVLFDYTQPTMWCCPVVAGDANPAWSCYTYDVGDYEVPGKPTTKDSISSIAAVGGKLYFIDSYQEMCAIDFASSAAAGDHPPEFQYFDVCMVDFPQGMCSGRTWLVESHDELYLVCVCFVGFDPDNIGAIHVYKMDFSTHSWGRVHDIGDVVFLLEDANMAASCPASPLQLKGNQIYFMKNLKEDDADLCVFDLETETQEIRRVHQHDLVIYRKPFWIVPPS